MGLTLNSIYEARLISHWASSILKATQKRLSNAMSSWLSICRKRCPAKLLGLPAEIVEYQSYAISSATTKFQSALEKMFFHNQLNSL